MSSSALPVDSTLRPRAVSGEVLFRRIGAGCTVLLALGGVATVALLVVRTAQQDAPVSAVADLMMGSLGIAVPSVLAAVPLALLVALFAAAYCPSGLRRRARDAVFVLGSCPPILWGLAAVWVVLPAFTALGLPLESALARSVVTLVLVVAPPLAASFVEQLRALPDELVFAGRALGGNTFSVHWHVLLPAILPAAVRAGFVALVRALGEGVALTVVLGSEAASRALAGGLVVSLLGQSDAAPGFAAGALMLVVTTLALLSLVHALTSTWETRPS